MVLAFFKGDSVPLTMRLDEKPYWHLERCRIGADYLDVVHLLEPMCCAAKEPLGGSG